MESQPESLRRYLRQIENRTEVLKQLTEELFRYSVIASVREDHRESVTLNRVLEESLMSCYGAFVQRGIQPEISITEEPVIRTLDPSSLNRIFGNILSNVLKYSDGDLTVSLTPDGTVIFTNAAKNMTPVMTARLSDRFYTIDTGSNSTGLGLSIARLLTERMGGSIQAAYLDGRLEITVTFGI